MKRARRISHGGGDKTRKRSRPLPRALLGGLFLLSIIVALLIGVVPALLPLVYVGFSCASYVMYSQDKTAALRAMRRTPEARLHFVDLLGGWPGALVAQQRLPHKTLKASFQSVFWCTVAANIVVAGWSVHGGLARTLSNTLMGGWGFT